MVGSWGEDTTAGPLYSFSWHDGIKAFRKNDGVILAERLLLFLLDQVKETAPNLNRPSGIIQGEGLQRSGGWAARKETCWTNDKRWPGSSKARWPGSKPWCSFISSARCGPRT